MRDAIYELLRSKKFVMAMLGMAAVILAKFGFHFDVEETMAWLTPLLAAILGQGIADHGKAAAIVASDLNREVIQRDSQRGSVTMDALLQVALMIVIGALAIAAASCNMKNEIKQAGRALVDCTKAESARAVRELGPVVDALLVSTVGGGTRVDFKPLESLAKGWSLDLGGCIVADAVARALAPTPEDPGAPRSSELEVDRKALAADFAAFKARSFAGASFKLANGAEL